MSDSAGSTDEERVDAKKIEREEEAKLKAKYPSVQKPGPGFLQKRLQKGQKYFDSGDYNMAKAAVGKGRLPVSALSQSPSVVPAVTVVNSPSILTGDTIPTPESVPVRKTSIHVPSKLAAEFSQS